ncbi:MAG: hypothetical protein C0594_00190 [Marinilabiliales bacterium]|nr:MAG: hypothetical protein C0594_00190 [Marinilabiliales bacterium]
MNSAFSLNDKIMIIKELFNSDADSCNDFIAKVNNSSNYEEAITMVKEKFTNMEESESLEKFIEITYRRFME